MQPTHILLLHSDLSRDKLVSDVTVVSVLPGFDDTSSFHFTLQPAPFQDCYVYNFTARLAVPFIKQALTQNLNKFVTDVADVDKIEIQSILQVHTVSGTKRKRESLQKVNIVEFGTVDCVKDNQVWFLPIFRQWIVPLHTLITEIPCLQNKDTAAIETLFQQITTCHDTDFAPNVYKGSQNDECVTLYSQLTEKLYTNPTLLSYQSDIRRTRKITSDPDITYTIFISSLSTD